MASEDKIDAVEDDYQTLDDIKTTLHPLASEAVYGYGRVPWRLRVRKEMFSPSETVTSPLGVNLIFCQVCDIFLHNCSCSFPVTKKEYYAREQVTNKLASF